MIINISTILKYYHHSCNWHAQNLQQLNQLTIHPYNLQHDINGVYVSNHLDQTETTY